MEEVKNGITKRRQRELPTAPVDDPNTANDEGSCLCFLYIYAHRRKYILYILIHYDSYCFFILSNLIQYIKFPFSKLISERFQQAFSLPRDSACLQAASTALNPHAVFCQCPFLCFSAFHFSTVSCIYQEQRNLHKVSLG